jgi:class 3 adenylate cyclase
MKSTADMSFDELVDAAIDDVDVHDDIVRRFRQEVAVLVVDFSSMRKRTDAFGIVHALTVQRAAMKAYLPAILAHRGNVYKTVADTCFAVFEEPLSALLAAMDGNRLMVGFNAERVGNIDEGIPGAPIHPQVGLGWGESLVVPDENVYGSDVNRAFILGEDVAGSKEILASDDFTAAIGVPPPGLGVFTAPHDRVQALGFSFHIFRDYRE